ncbi:hypothetical protein AAEX28_02445 [Lentisphaerota bacterium WC36G]|nr:hypothetical protein LJT99_05330 [Lentisphaerae bacterium WC36]
MQIKGIDNFRKNIKRAIKQRPKQLQKALNAIGDHHVKHAVARAPFLQGSLKLSIGKDVDMTNHNKPTVSIGVPLNAPASKYAIRMHEDYYELGEGSIALQDRSTVQIGRKYLSRGREVAQSRDEVYLKKYLKL